MMKKVKLKYLLLILFLSVNILTTVAQDSTYVITGKVTDANWQ